VNLRAGLAGLLLLAVAARATAAPDLVVGAASGSPGATVTVPVTFTTNGTAVAFQLDVLFPAADLAAGVPARGPAIAATDHALTTNVVAPGRLRLILTSNTLQLLPSGVAIEVPFTIAAAASAGVKALPIDRAEVVNAAAVRLQPTSLVAGSVTVIVDCVPGDIAPTGVGDGVLNLQDFVIGRRKLLGIVAAHARDAACGDLAPGAVSCDRATGTDDWCAPGDDVFSIADVVVLRRLLLEVIGLSCAACAPRTAPPAGPGDVAPPGGDGRVDVADAVVALRWATGLEAPSDEARTRADVAPAAMGGVGPGDGRLDVADVVLVLRAATGHATLAWPERELELVLEGPGPLEALVARVAGWPAEARLVDVAVAGCDGAGSGVDVGDGRWGLACSSDTGAIPGPVRLVVRYRGPAPVDLPSGSVVAEGIEYGDPDLQPVPLTLR
jgi:hypothetical protein